MIWVTLLIKYSSTNPILPDVRVLLVLLKLTSWPLGRFEHSHIRWAVETEREREKLVIIKIYVNVTRRITGISYSYVFSL